jgi:hypothetical protein
MSRPEKSIPPRRPPAERFRRLIAEAEGEGVERAAMVLRITLGDEAKLKRDPSVATEEISFLKGEMRFLGVKVVAGTVRESELDRGLTVQP